ncbi:MAG: PVC-type heme-binding CxxCH protein [Pirellulaceae bacterium]
MRLPSFLLLLVVCGLLFSSRFAFAADESAALGIQAPDGFEVSLFAGDDLAHDIFSMTIDSKGRIVVAGAGYVKILHDDNNDGKADRATLFSSKPASGAHGMVFVGNDLICTGDNSLMRLRDTNGDGVADGEPEMWAKLKSSEHGANGIVQGPDGWIYVACGNDAGVTAAHATLPTSPVKKPEAGAILRFSPDGKHSEIFAHGFRNIYDLDFNAFGQLFTVDSDGERDHHLPWYAPTRLFDVGEGMHHGWVLQGHQRSWNRPAYFPDVAPRLGEIGRGSPTGVVVYRHKQFPEDFRNAVFSACWTLGKVYCFCPENDQGPFATTGGERYPFLETTGEIGFAPVDLAVGPQGDMFVAIGGRHTRGSVFRIAYRGEGMDNEDNPIAEFRLPLDAGGKSARAYFVESVDDVLKAVQPLTAWSRAAWVDAARKLGRQEFLLALQDQSRDEFERSRAAEIITELFGGVSVTEATEILPTPDSKKEGWTYASRIVWSLGRKSRGRDFAQFLAEQARKVHADGGPTSYDTSANYGLALWQAVANLAGSSDEVDAELRFADPQLALVKERSRRSYMAILRADAKLRTPLEDAAGVRGQANLWRLWARGGLTPRHFGAALQEFLDADDPETRLRTLRLLQLSLGDINVDAKKEDVYAGYSANASAEELVEIRKEHGISLANQFPTFDEDINRELARLLGMLEVPDGPLIERESTFFVQNFPSNPDVIHFLITLSRSSGARSKGATQRTASGLFKAFHVDGTVSRNWPLRLGEVIKGLYERDPALAPLIAADGRLDSPMHSLLISPMPPELRVAATRQLLKQLDSSIQWTDDLVRLVGELPEEEALHHLRLVWLDTAVRESVILAAAKYPNGKDSTMFFEGLSSTQPDVVEASARAMIAIGDTPSDAELGAAFSAIRQHCHTLENKSTREALVGLLQMWSKQEIKIEEPKEPKEQKKLLAAYKPWFDWLEKEHPAVAKKVAGLGDATAEQWLARLLKVDWAAGDEMRGLAVFQKKACHKCHAGNSPLGPNLAGAAKRFSREDLFGAILDPHKDVAPPYQTTQIATSSGKVYSGLLVYESPDGTLVQTTPDTTIRIAGDEILSMKKGRVSLMPSGLLNDVSDLDLADLYAYLKTVKNVK